MNHFYPYVKDIKKTESLLNAIFAECFVNPYRVSGCCLSAGGGGLNPWILSKDVVLAVQYKVYLVKRVISVQYS